LESLRSKWYVHVSIYLSIIDFDSIFRFLQEFYQSLLSDLRRRFGRSVESESPQTLRILLAGIDCRGMSDVLVGPPSNPFSPAALGHRFELISSLLPRLVAFFRPIARHSRLNLVVLADTEQCADLYQNAYEKASESPSKWLTLEFSHIRIDEEYEKMEHGFSGTDIFRSLLELKAHDDHLSSAFGTRQFLVLYCLFDFLSELNFFFFFFFFFLAKNFF
jgi:hypothetical protein